MSLQRKLDPAFDVSALLRAHGVTPTVQRVLVARALVEGGRHMAAEDLFRIVNEGGKVRVSKATVYNTLGLLVEKGVIRSVVADPERIMYDPNTSPHHHFYDEVSGELIDVDAENVRLTALPPLPDGTELEGVDIIIRLRRQNRK